VRTAWRSTPKAGCDLVAGAEPVHRLLRRACSTASPTTGSGGPTAHPTTIAFRVRGARRARRRVPLAGRSIRAFDPACAARSSSYPRPPRDLRRWSPVARAPRRRDRRGACGAGAHVSLSTSTATACTDRGALGASVDRSSATSASGDARAGGDRAQRAAPLRHWVNNCGIDVSGRRGTSQPTISSAGLRSAVGAMYGPRIAGRRCCPTAREQSLTCPSIQGVTRPRATVVYGVVQGRARVISKIARRLLPFGIRATLLPGRSTRRCSTVLPEGVRARMPCPRGGSSPMGRVDPGRGRSIVAFLLIGQGFILFFTAVPVDGASSPRVLLRGPAAGCPFSEFGVSPATEPPAVCVSAGAGHAVLFGDVTTLQPLVSPALAPPFRARLAVDEARRRP